MKSRNDEDYWEQYASKAIYVQHIRERAGSDFLFNFFFAFFSNISSFSCIINPCGIIRWKRVKIRNSVCNVDM